MENIQLNPKDFNILHEQGTYGTSQNLRLRQIVCYAKFLTDQLIMQTDNY